MLRPIWWWLLPIAMFVGALSVRLGSVAHGLAYAAGMAVGSFGDPLTVVAILVAIGAAYFRPLYAVIVAGIAAVIAEIMISRWRSDLGLPHNPFELTNMMRPLLIAELGALGGWIARRLSGRRASRAE